MRTAMDVCGPDQLKVLQQVFDSIWCEMQHDPAFQFADQDELRNRVSRQVVESACNDLLDVEGIKRKVMSFWKSAA